MSEQPTDYRKTPPMLRPLNAEENGRHEITVRQNQRLEKDLTMAHIQLGDRHAELRVMRVAVEVLTGRALKAEHELGPQQQNQAGHEMDCLYLTARAEKAEARVKEQQAELAEQEVAKISLLNQLAAHKNNGRFPLCAICENGPALCECSPLPKKKK